MNIYQAKNLDEALKKVCLKYNCEIADIKYEVIEEKKGILGFGSTVSIKAYVRQDVKDFIFDYLGSFFLGINTEVKIEIIDKNDLLTVIIDSDDNARIIGKQGAKLQSLNIILRQAVLNTFKERFKISVDVSQYKQSRYLRLKKQAIKLAKDVLRLKQDLKLDPMPADERRIIHEALSRFDNIKTQSYGEKQDRHIVISYKGE